MTKKNFVVLGVLTLIVCLTGFRLITIFPLVSALLYVLVLSRNKTGIDINDKNNQDESNSSVEANYNLLTYRPNELNRIIAALLAKGCILVHGEEGIGKTRLITDVKHKLEEQGFKVAYGEGQQTTKELLKKLCTDAGVATENLNSKGYTNDQLKVFLAERLRDDTDPIFLVIDDAHLCDPKFRTWLKILHQKRVLMLLAATDPPRSSIFIMLPRIKLEPLPDKAIRQIMKSTAKDIDIVLKPGDLSRLQERAGGNPKLAIRTVNEEYLGIDNEEADHKRYVDMTPMLATFVITFTVMRFMGLASNNPSMYVFGGIGAALSVGFTQLIFRLPRESNRIR